MRTIEFIQNIENETWNKIRNSKSDAEARRILLECQPKREYKNKEERLAFSQWLLEEFSDSSSGNYYLGDGKYRYKYVSPYTLNELFNIFAEKQ